MVNKALESPTSSAAVFSACFSSHNRCFSHPRCLMRQRTVGRLEFQISTSSSTCMRATETLACIGGVHSASSQIPSVCVDVLLAPAYQMLPEQTATIPRPVSVWESLGQAFPSGSRLLDHGHPDNAGSRLGSKAPFVLQGHESLTLWEAKNKPHENYDPLSAAQQN